MFLLNTKNEVHTAHKVNVTKEFTFGRFFTPIRPIVSAENTKTVANAHARKVEKFKKVGRTFRKVYRFTTNFENVIGGKVTIPARMVFRTHGVTRFYSLDRATPQGNLVYKSMVGDNLTLMVN